MTSPSTRPERCPERRTSRRIYSLAVWGLAAGYAAFYAPYSALLKVMSRGLAPGIDPPSSPLVALPAIGLSTAVAATIIVASLGWWRYCPRRSIGRFEAPWPSGRMLASGVATAAIIYTTSLLFMFRGVSIVLALVIMRAGVLLLAPLLDLAFGRRVRWFAWTGFALSLLAVATIAAGSSTYQLEWSVAVTAGVYLSGYAIRLPIVNAMSKSSEFECNCRYFVGEQLVAMATLVVTPFILAVVGGPALATPIREGLTTFLTTTTVWLAITIGALYACLYCFGTLIYLDRRENTYCVALNRGSSLLAGAVGAVALSVVAGQRFPNAYELAAAATVLTAIVVLSPLHHAIERLWAPAPALPAPSATRAPAAPVAAVHSPTLAAVSAVEPVRVMRAGAAADHGRRPWR
jgi:hypothetical protein